MNDELQRSAAIGTTEDLIAIRAVFALIRSHDEAIPDHLSRFRLINLMSSEFVDIVLNIPFSGIESVPIDHDSDCLI